MFGIVQLSENRLSVAIQVAVDKPAIRKSLVLVCLIRFFLSWLDHGRAPIHESVSQRGRGRHHSRIETEVPSDVHCEINYETKRNISIRKVLRDVSKAGFHWRLRPHDVGRSKVTSRNEIAILSIRMVVRIPKNRASPEPPAATDAYFRAVRSRGRVIFLPLVHEDCRG